MPSPVNNPSPLGYWGVIASAAAQKLTTAALWAAISAFEAAQNIIRPSGLFQAVSQLRSLAVQQRTAATILTNASGGTALDSGMIAQDINARPLSEQALAPLFNIRFQVNTITSEGPSDMWLTLQHRGVLPPTKGDVVSLVGNAALDASTSYEALITGITGNLSITAA